MCFKEFRMKFRWVCNNTWEGWTGDLGNWSPWSLVSSQQHRMFSINCQIPSSPRIHCHRLVSCHCLLSEFIHFLLKIILQPSQILPRAVSYKNSTALQIKSEPELIWKHWNSRFEPQSVQSSSAALIFPSFLVHNHSVRQGYQHQRCNLKQSVFWCQISCHDPYKSKCSIWGGIILYVVQTRQRLV